MAPSADAYWLGLRRVRGLGPRTARLLLEKFESAERIFQTPEGELIEAGIPGPTARRIVEFNGFAALEKELCELPRLNARLVRWTDHDYPVALREIADPPPFLFARGTMVADERKCVAIVGARLASDGGRRMAQRLGMELAAKGFTVVSGLARGIDSEAHQGALEAGGRTIAVMGNGIDIIYPTEHRKLAESIVAGGGALLSELPVGTPPLAENFPTRNRILSGLSLGVIIVEAAERSGSLITARMALEQNRQVFAVPGSPLTGKTRGSNRLIKEGGKLVECVEDVIEELAPQLGETTKPPTSGASVAQRENSQPGLHPGTLESQSSEASKILSYLKPGEKVHVDALIESSGLSAQMVLRLLLELELKGVIAQHPGKLFSIGR